MALRFLKRLRLAWLILLGRVREGADGAMNCFRAHVAGDEIAVKKSRLEALERAADELKIARGVVAGLGGAIDLADAVRNTLGK